jgi:hypothetical protein
MHPAHQQPGLSVPGVAGDRNAQGLLGALQVGAGIPRALQLEVRQLREELGLIRQQGRIIRRALEGLLEGGGGGA